MFHCKWICFNQTHAHNSSLFQITTVRRSDLDSCRTSHSNLSKLPLWQLSSYALVHLVQISTNPLWPIHLFHHLFRSRPLRATHFHQSNLSFFLSLFLYFSCAAATILPSTRVSSCYILYPFKKILVLQICSYQKFGTSLFVSNYPLYNNILILRVYWYLTIVSLRTFDTTKGIPSWTISILKFL